MKKLENPKWEERIEDLRINILPRLQEMQRDTFGIEFFNLEVGVGTSGRYISVYASIIIDDEVLDSISLHLSIFDSREEIESGCAKLTDFIKEYSAWKLREFHLPLLQTKNIRIMSKWVQFYHKLNKFDLVNMRFTDEEETVEMVGMDSVMPIDGRWNMPSIRAAIQKKIERMKNFDDFDPCAFSILTGSSILNASESPVYNL